MREPQVTAQTGVSPVAILTERYKGPSSDEVVARLDLPDMDDVKAVVSWRGVYIRGDVCHVDLGLRFIRLLQEESCGRCGPCRIGVDVMRELFEKLAVGQGDDGIVERLRHLADSIEDSAWCGVANTIRDPIFALLDSGEEHFVAHADGLTCPPSTAHGWMTAPCRSACPSGVDCPSYIFQAGEEHPHLGATIVKRENPLPAIIGRTCPHPCEEKCTLAPTGYPVAINDIKRWCADRAQGLVDISCESGCKVSPDAPVEAERSGVDTAPPGEAGDRGDATPLDDGGGQDGCGGSGSERMVLPITATVRTPAHELGELVTAQPSQRLVAPDDCAIDEICPGPGQKVAIIGAGPAGLSAAYFLARRGYCPTIFESLSVPGGMLYVGIPAYRLPREIIHLETELIRQEGVEIRYNTRVGRDIRFSDLERQGFEATFIAIGAHLGRPLGIPGEGLPGSMDAISFLRRVALGEEVDIGERVLVLGGGDSAMDAARTAVRLGAAQVRVVYRRTRDEMPAHSWEIEEAEEEGVEFVYLAAPVECALSDSGGVEGLVCQQMELGEPDDSGRRRPVPVDMAPFVLEADCVIFAVGQKPDFSPFAEDGGLEFDHRGHLEYDPYTLATTKPGVFVGGDAVTGGGMVIEAINAGKTAAKYIDKYLSGLPVVEDIEDKTRRLALLLGVEESTYPLSDGVDYGIREKMPLLPAEVRKRVFDPVESGYTSAQAVAEAHRCLRCHRPILVAT